MEGAGKPWLTWAIQPHPRCRRHTKTCTAPQQGHFPSAPSYRMSANTRFKCMSAWRREREGREGAGREDQLPSEMGYYMKERSSRQKVRCPLLLRTSRFSHCSKALIKVKFNSHYFITNSNLLMDTPVLPPSAFWTHAGDAYCNLQRQRYDRGEHGSRLHSL